MIFITQNEPPTHVIDAQCAVQMWDDTIVAEEHSLLWCLRMGATKIREVSTLLPSPKKSGLIY
jgi:hypothetical protein